MESLAECLAAQDEIHGKYESLLLRVKDDFKPQLTRLHDLTIHSLEETATSIEEVMDQNEKDVEIKESGYPQIFNFIFQFFASKEDITDEELSRLSDSEILYLVSLLNCLPNTTDVINHIFKFTVFNHLESVENSLVASNPTLSCSPDWLTDAVLLKDIELVRRFATPTTPQECLNKAIFHADKETDPEIYRIISGLIVLEFMGYAINYNVLRIMNGMSGLAYSN